MRDRLKFRVWHKKRKKMYEVLHLHTKTWSNGGAWATAKGFNIITQQDIHINIEPSDCEIMQYTGLKDKNNKLVYENDIVTYDSRDLFPHTTIKTGKITWYKHSWVMSYFDKNIVNAETQKPSLQRMWLGCDDFISSRMEVIGNIYENEDLLNAT